ncbi:MAG: hypothetical protein AB1813_28210, partial [Verrucomicrobiota bacterium]
AKHSRFQIALESLGWNQRVHFEQEQRFNAFSGSQSKIRFHSARRNAMAQHPYAFYFACHQPLHSRFFNV